MNIVVGGLFHESNTFNPILTDKDNFNLHEGDEMLEKVASTKVFKEAGATVIPTIHAFGLPSGVVKNEVYRYFADKILGVLEKETEVDAIWLHLHGAMTVEGIGSAELQLLKEIREIVGGEIPISLTLDAHANNTDELTDYANIIRAYRSVPHIDQSETEIITARLLLESLKNNSYPKPAFKRLPMLIGGEQALGAREPLKSIYRKIEEMEALDGIATASFFIGFSWADTRNSSPSVIVVPESDEYRELANEKAQELVDYVYSKKEEFSFAVPALQPEEAIQTALNADSKPVFVTDSGDNTTGGGMGIYTYLLDMFLQKDVGDKKICIASIFDKEASRECAKYNIGDEIHVSVGINYDVYSKSIPVKGFLKAKGDLMGFLGSTDVKVGEVYVISIGSIDLVVANSGESFITIGHFEAAGLDLSEYDIIVVKQGYLFAELSAIAKLEILALTPGATYQVLEELEYENIPRPVYPLDQLVKER
ncbi:M81 family metallopeptidase [Oceanobacillus alkalisoli]|uniref:M81 family metallopeptidase n=1 Tax=Oceanobacillus alkalisoli TaxID=2925113 RepID=UPI001EE477A8|nr:M81 family metallopeptidase [Oceanobacillus alkalisoli]MCG5102402.1 M81 family metallopeptidase [Oceanobacillus alkalisoli]